MDDYGIALHKYDNREPYRLLWRILCHKTKLTVRPSLLRLGTNGAECGHFVFVRVSRKAPSVGDSIGPHGILALSTNSQHQSLLSILHSQFLILPC